MVDVDLVSLIGVAVLILVAVAGVLVVAFLRR